MSKETTKLLKSPLKQTAFTDRQHAILRHVWALDPDERAWLDDYYLLRSNVSTISTHTYPPALLEQYRDKISISGIDHEIEYMQCNYSNFSEVETEKDPTYGAIPVLLSVRRNLKRNFAVVIVKWAAKLTAEQLAVYKEFVPS